MQPTWSSASAPSQQQMLAYNSRASCSQGLSRACGSFGRNAGLECLLVPEACLFGETWDSQLTAELRALTSATRRVGAADSALASASCAGERPEQVERGPLQRRQSRRRPCACLHAAGRGVHDCSRRGCACEVCWRAAPISWRRAALALGGDVKLAVPSGCGRGGPSRRRAVSRRRARLALIRIAACSCTSLHAASLRAAFWTRARRCTCSCRVPPNSAPWWCWDPPRTSPP